MIPSQTLKSVSGLSPLARGTPNGDRLYAFRDRFIPAGAGNTYAGGNSTSTRPVYPRWRGEHSNSGRVEENISGLSPLARGTRCCSLLDWAILRFIPAGAGNTDQQALFQSSKTVYPRWRGEHAWPRDRYTLTYGLSPLARGTRLFQLIDQFHGRFIPAGAGNTPTKCQSDWAERFIPAGAGNTVGALCVIIVAPVYPRWRGEHSSIYASLNKSNGLSPLARGTQRAREHRFVWWRFIPAGAGNTGGIQRSTSV